MRILSNLIFIGLLGVCCYIGCTANRQDVPPNPLSSQLQEPWDQPASRSISAALDASPWIYWDTGCVCAPWSGVGAYKPSGSFATPTILVTSARQSGAGSLRSALLQAVAGSVIGFAASLKDSVIKLDSQLVISKNVTIVAIDAYGMTLDGQGKDRIFLVNANISATFIGLRMVHGKPKGTATDLPGGAISTNNDCNLTVKFCTFAGDTAPCGGAIRAGYGGITLVEDCTFAFNDGDNTHNGWSAGAIATNGASPTRGDLKVRRSLFVRNVGEVGGAIYNLLTPVEVDGCVFMGNRAVNGGGALFSDEGKYTADTTKAGHITVRNCWMEDNVSGEAGGALMLWNNSKDTVVIDKCVFRNDTVMRGGQYNVAQGGALRTRGLVTVSNSVFMGNLSQGSGGALWLDGNGPISIINSTFYRNRVTDDNGGAMTLNTPASAKVDIVNCTFAENFSQRACGLLWFGDPACQVTVTNSIAVNNKAGSDHSQDQVGYQPIDGGGNVEFPAPSSGARKFAAGSLVQNPLLDSVSLAGGTLVLPIMSTSPAIGRSIANKAPSLDGRGALRDGFPDAGAFEFRLNDNGNGRCNPLSVRMR